MPHPTLRVPDLARFGTARAGALIIIVLTVLGVAAGIVWNLVQGPQWTATTDVLIRLTAEDQLVLTGTPTDIGLADQVDLAAQAVSRDNLAAVVAQLHPRGGLTQLLKDVNATPQGDSHVVQVSATQPDPVLAQRVADAVADGLLATTGKRLAALSTGVGAAAGPPHEDADVLSRAQWIAKAVQPLQLFHSELPTRQSFLRAPAALGVVGLAAGALVVLALSFLGLRVDRPRDAQRLLSRPAVAYDRANGSPGAARLVQALLREHSSGALLVCPVDPDAELAAVRFAGWLREHGQGEHGQGEHGQGEHGQDANGDAPREVRLVPDPTTAVVTARPSNGDAAGLLLVVPKGTSRQVVGDAAALLSTWRAVDAVAVTT